MPSCNSGLAPSGCMPIYYALLLMASLLRLEKAILWFLKRL